MQISTTSRINNRLRQEEAKHLQVIHDLPRLWTLALLCEKPRCGYEIMRSFNEELACKISPSFVYPFLNSLERDSLVSVSSKRGSRGKRVFKLTREGKLACKSMFQQFSRMASTILDENICTCINCGCLVLGKAHPETIDGKVLSFCCESCARSFKEPEENNTNKDQAVAVKRLN